jgi:O-antigen/teichoic acid export membrane protein
MNRNIFWSAAEAGSAALLSIVASFAIARLIGPAELGLGAAGVAVHVLLWVAVNALFADALAQARDVDSLVISSASRVSVAVGFAAALVQAGSGWALSLLLDDARLLPMALLLAAPLPIVGAAGVRQGLLTRNRAYRHLALRTILGQGAGVTLGIALALDGFGAWALVGQQAATSTLGALILLIGWRPNSGWSSAAVRALLRTGLPLTASTLLQIGRYRLFVILIGATAGAEALGQVHIAFRLVDTVRELTFTALWRLMLPILAAHRDDRMAMLARVDRLLCSSAIVTIPLCAAMALTLPALVAVLFGPGWGAAGIAAEPLVAAMALQALMFPSGVALVAAGQARFTLFANLAGLAATVAFVPLFRPADAWQAAMVWCAAQMFVSPYALWTNGRALGVGPLRPLFGGIGFPGSR